MASDGLSKKASNLIRRKSLESGSNISLHDKEGSVSSKKISDQEASETASYIVSRSRKYLKKVYTKVYFGRKISIAGLKSFNTEYWLLCVLVFIQSCLYEAFIVNVAGIYQSKFSMGLQQTGLIMSIPAFMMIVCSPFLGVFFDRIGKRVFYIMIGFVLNLAAHMQYATLPKCPPHMEEHCWDSLLPMFLLGLGTTVIKISLYTGMS